MEICGSAQLDVSTWHMVPEILSRIRPPIFPDQDFLILDYDAVEGGDVDNTNSFRRAIAACNAAGGGRVIVPAVSVFNSTQPVPNVINIVISCIPRVCSSLVP